MCFSAVVSGVRKRFIMLLCAVVSVSCSVKEDRRDCPCYLEIDLMELSGLDFPEVGLCVTGDGGFEWRNTFEAAEYGEPYILEVPRSGVIVRAFFGTEGDIGSGGPEFVIPVGEECPPLYLHVDKVDTSPDVARDTIRLHKNFCTLDITMKSRTGEYPFDVGIRGWFNGYNPDGTPSEGDFNIESLQTDHGRCFVRIPRQNDSSLLLEVREGDAVLRRFALGEYIAASGYDWSAPDLKDISITVDYAKIGIDISVDDWTRHEDFDIEI